MGVSLGKYGKVGWQIQSGKGVEADGTSVTWVPMADRPTFKRSVNQEVFRPGDRHHDVVWTYPSHHNWAGGLPIYLVPGACTDIITLLQTRNSYNQARWMTVWKVQRNRVEVAMDVKIRTAEFTLANMGPIRVNLDLAGLSDGTNKTPAGYASAIAGSSSTACYLSREITMTYATGDDDDLVAGAATDYNIKSVRLTIDELVEDAAEGLRFNGSFDGYQLYNTGSPVITGSIERDHVSPQLYNAYLRQGSARGAGEWYNDTNDGYLQVDVARGGSSITLECPRIRYIDYEDGMLGTTVGVQTESVNFQALGSLDGTIPAITLT